MNTELELIIPAEAKKAASELSVPENRALELFKPFAEPFKAALELLDQESTATTAKDARALRLKMVKARTAIRDVKDAEKEGAKITAKIVDFYHNGSTSKLSEAEARLKAIEEAEERAELARQKALCEARTTELVALGADPQFYPLGTMQEAGYAQLLAGLKAEAARKKAEELKAAEEARIAAEKAEAERLERERIAAEEAARLKAEQEAKLAEAQRLAAEAAEQARIEREARERVEAEAKAEADRLAEEARKVREEVARLGKIEAERLAAELEAKRQADLAAKRAAQAPDKEKLIALADAVFATAMPTVSTPEAQAIVEEFQSMLQRARAWIIKKTEAM